MARGPCFGGGCDIDITHNCNAYGSNLTYTPYTYNVNIGSKNKNENSVLAGCHRFKLLDYEVFQLIKK